MQIITLQNTWIDLHIIYPLPDNGWLASTNYIINPGPGGFPDRPIVFRPGQEPVVYEEPGYIERRKNGAVFEIYYRLFIVKETTPSECTLTRKGPMRPVNERGLIAKPGEKQLTVISPEMGREHKDFYVSSLPSCRNIEFEKQEYNGINRQKEALQIAAGLIDGGIVIVRKSDKATACLSFPQSGYSPCVSDDGLTILCRHKNVVTIVDNPLA